MDGSIKLTVLEDADLGDAGDGTALKRFPHLDGCTPLKLPGSAETQVPCMLPKLSLYVLCVSLCVPMARYSRSCSVAPVYSVLTIHRNRQKRSCAHK